MEVVVRSLRAAGLSKQRTATARRPGRGTLLLLLCFLLLSGCTTSLRQWAAQGFKVGPEYGTPCAPTADRWIDADAAHVNSDETPSASWWAVFNDPVLDELIAAASRQNLGMQEAGERILEARARLAVARGGLFPQTQEAFGTFTHTQMSRTIAKPIKVPFYDDWATGLNASWELDFWGRFRRGVEAAEADMQAAVEDYRDVLVLLQAEVAAAYLQIRVVQERIALARRNVQLQENTLALAELRFREGKTTKLDVTQAQENLAATRALVPQLDVALRESQNALCVLLGVPPYDLQSELGFRPIPAAPPQAAVGIPAQLLARRPDVRRAERLVAAQSARIGIAEADLYPRIAITGTIGYESTNLSSLFQGTSLIGSVGPGFRWNILNYGRIRSNVRAEEARLRQLVLKYQEVVLKADQEVENAINRFLRAQERVRFLEDGVAAANESVALAESQYQVGKVDFQRLLDSQRALVQFQDQLTAARGEVVVSLVAIYKALGGGWQPATESGPANQTQDGPAAEGNE